LGKKVGSSDDLSLPKLTGIAGLSRSRFMHAFTESVGTPLRPYILWLRLQLASGQLAAGTNITEIAHRAGFSDGAHWTRTFRRMLGTTPSEIAQRTSHGISLQPKMTLSCGNEPDSNRQGRCNNQNGTRIEQSAQRPHVGNREESTRNQQCRRNRPQASRPNEHVWDRRIVQSNLQKQRE
jgi:AraC-like DNA-binding protein